MHRLRNVCAFLRAQSRKQKFPEGGWGAEVIGLILQLFECYKK